MKSTIELSAAIRAAARRAGFEHVGFTPAVPAPRAERLRAWLDAGMHGTMGYMEDPEGRRADPARYVEWARSVIVTALAYRSADAVSQDPAAGAISSYAWGRDYHRVVRERLEALRRTIGELAPGARTHPFVDTSPVLEKGLAEAAGLGWRGKHTNLIARRDGSWFFLGGVLTDLELAADPPAPDRCGTCTRCIDVCPTGAIVAPYVVDARRCIAYLTIEHRGSIDPALRPAIGNRVFGCDDCQDVCPWNRHAVRTRVPQFSPRDGAHTPPLLELMAMSRSDWNRRFKKTPVRRATYEGFLRNVAIALGNWAAPDAVPALVARLADDSALVRAHVAWALGRCGGEVAQGALRARRVVEPEGDVLEEIELALAHF
jgi:epoxyqueuosine reductase